MKYLTLAVIIATRNRPHLLKGLVDELILQMEQNDYIIICDASDSKNRVIDNRDSRIFYISNASIGVTANRNLGLKLLSQLNFDYWSFLDDDLDLQENYFEVLRHELSKLKPNFGLTGTLNGSLIPKNPDWLGYFNRSALRSDDRLLMPHSVGTWLPKTSVAFKYKSSHLYGYDELELQNYLATNSIGLLLSKKLNIDDLGSELSTGKLLSNLELHQIRIIQNFRFNHSLGQIFFKKYIYVYLCLLHLIVRGDQISRNWSLRMAISPLALGNWLEVSSRLDD